MLKLNCRVVNMKTPQQDAVNLVQYPRAFRRRNIRNRHMAGKRMRLRSKAPDMQIMNFFHTFNALKSCPYLIQ